MQGLQDTVDPDDIKGIRELLVSFFPDAKEHSEEELKEQLGANELLVTKEKILSYLQTAFFEEHLLEIQPDKSTRTFFTNLVDNPPQLDEQDEEDIDVLENNSFEYEEGAYPRPFNQYGGAPLFYGNQRR